MRLRGRRARSALAGISVLLPHRGRRFVHRRLLGHDIGPTASLGRAYIDVDHLVMAQGSSIGSLTVIRGCERVDLAEHATIGPLVYVNAVRKGGRYFQGVDRHPAVILGRGALISCMHFIDACDTVRLGDYADFGGFGSQILTHSIDLVRMRQSASPVTIGEHCLVGTRVVLLPGTAIPDCSVVSAGSVMSPSSVRDGYRLYSGVPAEPGRALNPRIPFFRHTIHDVV